MRALRRRRRLRQVDLAVMAHVPQSTISDLERGHVEAHPIRTLRAVLAALDARCEFDVLWRGGALDRLLDERHARLVEAVVATLQAAGWDVIPELTYSEFGERGSIDVVGLRPDLKVALVGEIKSEITAIETTNRRFDPKIRLAPTIIRKQFGFVPTVVGAVLVLPEDSTARRRVADHRATFAARLPARAREIRAWLDRPEGALRGIWFLSDNARHDAKRRPVTPDRVRKARRPCREGDGGE